MIVTAATNAISQFFFVIKEDLQNHYPFFPFVFTVYTQTKILNSFKTHLIISLVNQTRLNKDITAFSIEKGPSK